jgi:prepilin-type N-terminal cleavage/methylation domain-containing protein
MLKLRKMLKKNRKGFTLIELIVVIAILAILALLAIPRFLGTLEDARYNTHNANVRTIESAVALYMAANNVSDITTMDDINVLETDYLKEVPEQPVSDLDPYTISDGAVLPGLYEKDETSGDWAAK